MATSESDDFESADEEMIHDVPVKRNHVQQWCSAAAIDSESDDDTEYVPRVPCPNVYHKRPNRSTIKIGITTDEKKIDKVGRNIDGSLNDTECCKKSESLSLSNDNISKNVNDEVTITNLHTDTDQGKMDNVESEIKDDKVMNLDKNVPDIKVTNKIGKSKEKVGKQKKLGAKKLGTKVMQGDNFTHNRDNVITSVERDISIIELEGMTKGCAIMDEVAEFDMPEEMKSDKKFKEVFKPQGWEGLGDVVELPEELTEEKLEPILKRLSSAGQELENVSIGWGWGNWGVSSLINTATVGVSTLTSHVSHGLTLLEESMNISEETKPSITELEETPSLNDDKTELEEQVQTRSSFGFGNLISGVSSITKLVESTGNKVVSGGLDTLEAIGKKTMEVLQDGDPGLRKKRAFFMNDMEKPVLSQILREAKEKAENVERSIEEKKRMRKVHFESLFDDYQGLVHLEALEMLSKQSEIKIQGHLNSLDTKELKSLQETLEEIRDLCDLEDTEFRDNVQVDDLKFILQEACTELEINITFEKINTVCEDSKVFLASCTTYTNQEIFEHAISLIAQFTAYCVERFHKTAELLLVKEHRSTASESDTLIHLTFVFCKQISVLADMYCRLLNEQQPVSSSNDLVKTSDVDDSITNSITTIFMEASNASSYIQDAFKLLIPIMQVGII